MEKGNEELHVTKVTESCLNPRSCTLVQPSNVSLLLNINRSGVLSEGSMLGKGITFVFFKPAKGHRATLSPTCLGRYRRRVIFTRLPEFLFAAFVYLCI